MIFFSKNFNPATLTTVSQYFNPKYFFFDFSYRLSCESLFRTCNDHHEFTSYLMRIEMLQDLRQ